MLTDQELVFCHKLALLRSHRLAAIEAQLPTDDTYLAEILSRDDIAAAVQMARGYLGNVFERAPAPAEKTEDEMIGDLVGKIGKLVDRVEEGEIHPQAAASIKGLYELQAKLQGLLKDKLEITRRGGANPADMTTAELRVWLMKESQRVSDGKPAIEGEFKRLPAGPVGVGDMPDGDQ